MESTRHYRATQVVRRETVAFSRDLSEFRHELGVRIRGPRGGVAQETFPDTAHDNKCGRRGRGKKRYRPSRTHAQGEW